eukprot:358649-Chlamydomonas_euryale.AAC.2
MSRLRKASPLAGCQARRSVCSKDSAMSASLELWQVQVAYGRPYLLASIPIMRTQLCLPGAQRRQRCVLLGLSTVGCRRCSAHNLSAADAARVTCACVTPLCDAAGVLVAFAARASPGVDDRSCSVALRAAAAAAMLSSLRCHSVIPACRATTAVSTAPRASGCGGVGRVAFKPAAFMQHGAGGCAHRARWSRSMHRADVRWAVAAAAAAAATTAAAATAAAAAAAVAVAAALLGAPTPVGGTHTTSFAFQHAGTCTCAATHRPWVAA